MAGAFQQTIIIGNVGRDPEWKVTPQGVSVCDFSVAVTERWTDRGSNQQKERTNWYRVTAWRGLADVCKQYVRKGMSIMVTGNVTATAYIGQDGQARASLDLTARDIQFLTRADGASGGGGSDNYAPNNYNDYDAPPPNNIDDIPF